MYIKKVGLFIFYIFLIGSLEGQRIPIWIDRIDQEGYKEGIYALQVDAPIIDLVSLTSFFEAYELNQGHQLYVRFYSPLDSTYFLIKAEEKRVTEFYWMESDPNTSNKDWNFFPPWSVDGQLSQRNIKKENLGVIIRLKNDNSRYLSPALIYHSSPPSNIDSYTAIFRLGVHIRKAEYEIYKGDHTGIPPEKNLLDRGLIGKKFGSSNFSINLDSSKLGDYEGWLTVDMTLFERGKPTVYPYKFYFFHKNL